MNYSKWTDLTSQDWTSGDVDDEQAEQFGNNLDGFLVELDLENEEDINDAVQWYYDNVGTNDVYERSFTDEEDKNLANQYRNK